MMSDNESQATIPSDLEDDGGPEDQNITLIRLVKQKEFLYIKSSRRYSDIFLGPAMIEKAQKSAIWPQMTAHNLRK